MIEERLVDRELEAFRAVIATDIKAESSPKVRKSLSVIQSNLFEPHLSVSTVMDELDIRSNAFKQEFKYHRGQPIRDYIEDRRMMAAMRLLSFPSIDVTTIAYRIGYNDYRSFARAFKRYVGCSATSYRERIPT